MNESLIEKNKKSIKQIMKDCKFNTINTEYASWIDGIDVERCSIPSLSDKEYDYYYEEDDDDEQCEQLNALAFIERFAMSIVEITQELDDEEEYDGFVSFELIDNSVTITHTHNQNIQDTENEYYEI